MGRSVAESSLQVLRGLCARGMAYLWAIVGQCACVFAQVYAAGLELILVSPLCLGFVIILFPPK